MMAKEAEERGDGKMTVPLPLLDMLNPTGSTTGDAMVDGGVADEERTSLLDASNAYSQPETNAALKNTGNGVAGVGTAVDTAPS